MTRQSRKEMVEEALKIGARLFRVTLPIVPKEMLELDVTMTQLKILFLLFVDGAKRMSDLAADLGVTLATASGLADRLVERNFITRESQPDDRRVVLCRLSAAGEKAINRIWETAANRLRDLLRALDTADIRVLTDVLNKMLDSAEREHQKTLNCK
jgi:DNA-binding MarR family transcriptional regulator